MSAMDYRLEDGTPAFRNLLQMLERVASGFSFTEGPVWRGDDLLFSDIPNSRTVRYRPLAEGPEITTFRHPTNNSNGLTLDLDGNLLACEHTSRSVTRVDAQGQVTTLAASYEGKRLNSPNDIVVRSDGTIFFTDPPFGLRRLTEGRESPYAGVYRIDLDGSLHIVAEDFQLPNGLAFSPDEEKLYVDDSAHFHIRAFDVSADGSLSNGIVLAELKPRNPDERGVVDGMKVDSDGNIYCTGPGGVWILNDAGRLLGRIVMPEVTANLAWAGADWRTLYLTGSTSLYRMQMRIPGIPVGRALAR
jgi:gluconolactonase